MKEPSLSTIKRLFARSNNHCAYPGCSFPIVEESGTVTGIVCHIKARSRGGPRYDPKQTPEERHHFNNLILMCARHSKLVDSEPMRFTVELLKEMKEIREREGSFELSPGEAKKAEALHFDYSRTYNISAGGHVMVDSPGSVQAGNVVFKTVKRKIKLEPPEGCIASDLMQRNYVKHLIDRYNEFASQQRVRKGTFSYAAIYGLIKKEFRADWDKIPIERFEELVNLIQSRINRTEVGSINRGKGYRNYSTYTEYRREHGHQKE